MANDKERLIPFTEETFDRVQDEAGRSRRHFKHEAAVLIEEGLAARAEREAVKADG